MQIIKNLQLVIVKFSILILCVCLVGCNDENENNNYYLSFMDESKSWMLKGYEIVITPKTFMAGNGILSMKGKDEYYTDYINIVVYAVINDEERSIHSYTSFGNTDMNIAQKNIGKIDGSNYINKDGKPITLGNISEIYMVIQWRDKEQKRVIEERISLYQ